MGLGLRPYNGILYGSNKRSNRWGDASFGSEADAGFGSEAGLGFGSEGAKALEARE